METESAFGGALWEEFEGESGTVRIRTTTIREPYWEGCDDEILECLDCEDDYEDSGGV